MVKNKEKEKELEQVNKKYYSSYYLDKQNFLVSDDLKKAIERYGDSREKEGREVVIKEELEWLQGFKTDFNVDENSDYPLDVYAILEDRIKDLKKELK